MIGTEGATGIALPDGDLPIKHYIGNPYGSGDGGSDTGPPGACHAGSPRGGSPAWTAPGREENQNDLRKPKSGSLRRGGLPNAFICHLARTKWSRGPTLFYCHHFRGTSWDSAILSQLKWLFNMDIKCIQPKN